MGTFHVADAIIILLLALLVIWAIRRMVQVRRSGGCASCGGQCANCQKEREEHGKDKI